MVEPGAPLDCPLIMPDLLYLVVLTPVLPVSSTPAVSSVYIVVASSTGTHTHSFPFSWASEITIPSSTSVAESLVIR